MPKLPVLSAKELIKILTRLGFEIYNQKGSHIKLKRKTIYGKEIVIIPNHKVIRKGTLKNILNKINLSLEKLLELL
ncbi:type II toxin-antitoxin system HicA family toxin [Patescibacteria group bacterium]|nr:type II toxin-antitoxin system HicA family toxin [Patescibacteria group bacterium]